jgi:peptidoglycan/xylan/chitin deacetylase (PgdA/CDA1 family)
VYAADALRRRGWRGHFFLVSSLIGRRTFATPSDIRYLASCGHVLGTHSHTHPDIFPDLTPERMLEEWRTSAQAIEDIVGAPCLTASIPGGDLSPQVIESAARAGVRYLFTSEPWLLPRAVNGCWVLGRFSPKVGTTAVRIGELAQFRGWTSALMVRRLKGLARTGLPLLYRQYVRHSTRAQPGLDQP